MPMFIEVAFDMTPEMYQRVTRELLNASFQERRKRIWLIMAVGMAALVLLTLWGEAFSLRWLLVYGPVLVLVGLMWWLIFRYLPGFVMSKKRFPPAHPLRYTFSEEGVKITTATSDSMVQWAGYHKVQETHEWLLLYPNKMMANPVLKSAFAPGDLERLRGLLQQNGLIG